MLCCCDRTLQLRDEQLILNREKADLRKEIKALEEERATFEKEVKDEWVLPADNRRVVLNVGGQVGGTAIVRAAGGTIRADTRCTWAVRVHLCATSAL